MLLLLTYARKTDLFNNWKLIQYQKVFKANKTILVNNNSIINK